MVTGKTEQIGTLSVGYALKQKKKLLSIKHGCPG